MSYRAILLAVDMGPENAATIDYAFAFGEKVGAIVHLLQASPFAVATEHDSEASARAASIEHAKRELETALAAHRASPSMGRRLVSVSEPITAILKAAATVSADLIILSTHARRGVGRLLIGSVMEGVLEEAKVPVLVMKGPPTTTPNTDSSSSSQPHDP